MILEVVDPDDHRATAALARYFAELDERFPGGFDPGDPSAPADAAAFRQPRGRFVVAIDGDATVGCGGVTRLDDDATPEAFDEPVAEVKRMWVAPSHRGAGLGRRVLAALEDHARELGASRVVLDTNGSLAEALAFYPSAGYEPTERYNDNAYAQAWFTKRLV